MDAAIVALQSNQRQAAKPLPKVKVAKTLAPNLWTGGVKKPRQHVVNASGYSGDHWLARRYPELATADGINMFKARVEKAEQGFKEAAQHIARGVDSIEKGGGAYYPGFQLGSAYNNAQVLLELKNLAFNYGASITKAAQAIGIPPNTANELALFVPQDLRRTWSAIIASREDVVISPLLPMVPAFSTQIQWVVETADGGRRLQTHFMGESGPLVGNNLAVARTGTANVKLFADRRTLTTIAQVVGMIGGINPGGVPVVSRNGLEKVTAAMVREQMTEYERMTFFGDSDVDPLEFDGLIKQIRDNGAEDLNVHDMLGEPLTFERFLRDAARLMPEPNFAKIEFFVVPPAVYADLQIQASDTKRWVQGAAEIVRVNNQWTFNPSKMVLIGPMNNEIQIKVATYLAPPPTELFPTSAMNTPAQAVTIANMTSATAGGSGTTFPAGTYKVGIVAAFGGGASAGFFTNNINVSSGEEITVVMNDSAIGTTENPLRWYEAWLTLDGGDTSTALYVGRFPAKNVSGHTEFTIDYSTIPGTSHALGLMINGLGAAGVFRASLMESTRFTIPYQGLGTDMVLCSITTPVVAHYEQQLLYYNVGLSEAA